VEGEAREAGRTDTSRRCATTTDLVAEVARRPVDDAKPAVSRVRVHQKFRILDNDFNQEAGQLRKLGIAGACC